MALSIVSDRVFDWRPSQRRLAVRHKLDFKRKEHDPSGHQKPEIPAVGGILISSLFTVPLIQAVPVSPWGAACVTTGHQHRLM